MMTCAEKPPEKGTVNQILKTNEAGDFRGINIGDKYSSVLEHEGEHTVYTMPDELAYRIPLGQKDSTFYEITYNFNEQGLYDIAMVIFPSGQPEINKLVDDFTAYYITKYGQPLNSPHAAEWRIMTGNGRIVKVIIADSLQKEGRPYMKVNFNEYNR